MTERPLRQAMTRLDVATRPRGAVNLTAAVDRWLAEADAGDGLLTLFLRHTSASLTVQENASPEVLPDLADALDRMAPRGPHWRHDLEGDDDMPAHVKATLTGVSLAVPGRRRSHGPRYLAGGVAARAPRHRPPPQPDAALSRHLTPPRPTGSAASVGLTPGAT